MGIGSLLQRKKVIQSMSKAGCPYDNTLMERFYNRLKNELIYPNHFYTEWELDEALSRYVFVWYNHIKSCYYDFFDSICFDFARHRVVWPV